MQRCSRRFPPVSSSVIFSIPPPFHTGDEASAGGAAGCRGGEGGCTPLVQVVPEHMQHLELQEGCEDPRIPPDVMDLVEFWDVLGGKGGGAADTTKIRSFDLSMPT